MLIIKKNQYLAFILVNTSTATIQTYIITTFFSNFIIYTNSDVIYNIFFV